MTKVYFSLYMVVTLTTICLYFITHANILGIIVLILIVLPIVYSLVLWRIEAMQERKERITRQQAISKLLVDSSAQSFESLSSIEKNLVFKEIDVRKMKIRPNLTKEEYASLSDVIARLKFGEVVNQELEYTLRRLRIL